MVWSGCDLCGVCVQGESACMYILTEEGGEFNVLCELQSLGSVPVCDVCVFVSVCKFSFQ